MCLNKGQIQTVSTKDNQRCSRKGLSYWKWIVIDFDLSDMISFINDYDSMTFIMVLTRT